MADRFLNLVFQGGGVRGVAYAGALQELPASFRVHTVAGASAGSIVAALLAIGKTPDQIKSLLSEKEFFQLIQPTDAQRTARLVAAFSDMRNAWDPKTSKLSLFQAWRIRRKHKSIFQDVGQVMAQKECIGRTRFVCGSIGSRRVRPLKRLNLVRICVLSRLT